MNNAFLKNALICIVLLSACTQPTRANRVVVGMALFIYGANGLANWMIARRARLGAKSPCRSCAVILVALLLGSMVGCGGKPANGGFPESTLEQNSGGIPPVDKERLVNFTCGGESIPHTVVIPVGVSARSYYCWSHQQWITVNR